MKITEGNCLISFFRFCDIVHRNVQHLGSWVRLPNPTTNCIPSATPWSSSASYSRGSVVKHGRDFYRAEGTVLVPRGTVLLFAPCTAKSVKNSVFSRFSRHFVKSSQKMRKTVFFELFARCSAKSVRKQCFSW